MLVDLIRVPDPKCIDDLLDEPLGLFYLAASLRENGYNVKITNLAGHDYESWRGEISEADVYGIQLYSPTLHIGLEIAKYLKKKFPKKPIVCGGAHPSALPESDDLQIFDVIVQGEGEEALVEIVERFNKNLPVQKVFKSRIIKEIDGIPIPVRDLVDMNVFHRKVEGKRCFGIMGSRGCSYKCAFCDQAVFGNRVRFRSVDNIVGEIKKVIETYHVRHFEFFDDMLTVNKKRLVEFRNKVKELNIIYRCNARTDMNDLENYKMLYESGARVVCFGIESGSQKILDLMNKQNKVENAYRAIEQAHDAGLIVNGYFIIGFPGETKETIEETMKFIEKSDIDQAQAYTFVPLPGCDVYKYPEKYGITSMTKDYSEYYLVFGNEALGGRTIETKFLTAEEIEEQMKRIRQFLKKRPTRGQVQDYYKNVLGYNVAG